MDVQSVSSFFLQVPIEAVAALVFVGLLAFDAYRSGTGRATAFALSMPIAHTLFLMIPHTIGISGLSASLESPMLQTGLFVVLFAATFFLIHRMLMASFGIPSPFMLALLCGVATLVVGVVTILQIPALVTVLHPSTMVQAIFAAPYHFIWIIGAYLALAFARS